MDISDIVRRVDSDTKDVNSGNDIDYKSLDEVSVLMVLTLPIYNKMLGIVEASKRWKKEFSTTLYGSAIGNDTYLIYAADNIQPELINRCNINVNFFTHETVSTFKKTNNMTNNELIDLGIKQSKLYDGVRIQFVNCLATKNGKLNFVLYNEEVKQFYRITGGLVYDNQHEQFFRLNVDKNLPGYTKKDLKVLDNQTSVTLKRKILG